MLLNSLENWIEQRSDKSPAADQGQKLFEHTSVPGTESDSKSSDNDILGQGLAGPAKTVGDGEGDGPGSLVGS